MTEITFDRQTSYKLISPIYLSKHKVTLYFSGYHKDIDYSNGFIKWVKYEESSEDYKMIQDYSRFRYKWNIITEMNNGIVLTDDPNYVETEKDNFVPLDYSKILSINEDLQRMIENTHNNDSIYDRISILESEIASLKAAQK